MTESSVSSPFMTLLRQELPGSVVVKHADKSFIGLPDCSVNWNSRTLWLEFKLIILIEEVGKEVTIKTGSKSQKVIARFPVQEYTLERVCRAVAEESPVQFELVKRLDIQAWAAYYVVWVRKQKKIFLWNPNSQEVVHQFSNNSMLATWIKRKLGDPEE